MYKYVETWDSLGILHFGMLNHKSDSLALPTCSKETPQPINTFSPGGHHFSRLEEMGYSWLVHLPPPSKKASPTPINKALLTIGFP